MGEQVLRVKDQSGNVHDLATQNQALEYAVRVVDEDTYTRLNELAKEATLGAIQSLLNNEDFAQNSTLEALRVAFNAEDFASEATLSALNTAFSAEDFASETTLSSIDSKVATNAQLTTLTDELSALHADLGDVSDLDTANTVIGRLKRILAVMVSLDSKDFATETTLAALNANFVGEDFASEATLSAFKNAFDTRDLASGADIANLQAEVDNLEEAIGTTSDLDTANTVIGRLQRLINLFDSEDFASETTLGAFRTDFQNEDFATETTLQAVQSAVDAINANTDTLESLLTTIRDEQHRRTDPLAAGNNLLGYVSSNAVRLSSLGRVFIGTSNELSAGLGQDINATISNPVGSGVNMLLVRITATSESSGGLVVGDVLINPTTNLPTTSFTPFCTAVGAASAQGQFKVDTSNDPISGGQATDLHIGLVGSGRMVFDLEAPVIISPGITLGLTIPLGALESTDGTFAAYWIEEPV